MTDDARAKLDGIIGHFDTAMLVTVSLEGKPRARPMAILEHAADGSLHFATRADDAKRDEIQQAPEVAVTMQGSDQYLSLSGRARLVESPRPAPELPLSVRPWFPEGADDPQFMLIVVDPEYAEFWDRSGLRRLKFLWEAGKALVQGEPLSERDVGGHEKLRLSAADGPERRKAGAAASGGAAVVTHEGLRHGFSIGEWAVDPEQRTVVSDGQREHLSALAMDFLMVLAASPGDVVDGRLLGDRLGVPPGRELARCLAELQHALGDSPDDPHYVRKVGDAGFQLVAPVHIDVPPVPTPDQILD